VILYLDPSAWIKYWIEEEGSPEVRGALADPAFEAIACSRLGRVEMVATFARAWSRRKRMTRARAESCRKDFASMWQRTVEVDFSPEVQARAEGLASKYALRGYDAVHLASALHLNSGSESVLLLTFDQEMREACRSEGLPWRQPSSR
jgi:predicted nucleic acid-binding protein